MHRLFHHRKSPGTISGSYRRRFRSDSLVKDGGYYSDHGRTEGVMVVRSEATDFGARIII